MKKKLLITVGVLGFLGVAIGAFGAHGLEKIANEKEIANFNTGVRYHMLHTLALLGLVAATTCLGDRAMRVVYWSFIVGIVLFSGSLYLYALTGKTFFGAITPIGGLAFLVGWGALMVGAAKGRADSSGEQ